MAGLLGSFLQAESQIEKGQAQQAASNFKAKISEQDAVLSRQAAAEDERRFRITARKQIGAQRAAIGASGITLEGSPLDVLQESAANGELDALTIRHGGEISARGFVNDASILRFGGEVAQRNARLSAAGTLLSGFAQAASKLPSGGG